MFDKVAIFNKLEKDPRTSHVSYRDLIQYIERYFTVTGSDCPPDTDEETVTEEIAEFITKLKTGQRDFAV